MTIVLILFLLQCFILHYNVFGVFATDTIRNTWTSDTVKETSNCIEFEPFREFCRVHIYKQSSTLKLQIVYFQVKTLQIQIL